MKTQLNFLNRLLVTIILFTLTLFSSQAAIAQLLSNEGYWVVESNINTKDFTVVKFYDNTHSLIYEEKLTGICLDISRRKIVKMLNRTLKMVQHNQVVAGQIKGYSDLIASSISKKRYDN
ncbi:hypothetical protein GXP67_15195 [Rhodocytophaga rosea]|uniref:Uncharacterized protein n=1 Tax=Rhodocytophaga rosea TaxID=2704465 RepID=A0A6C0GIQ6_9BACT|nr:hypothetical protein [Rhodocytophaga rosea]QHT67888.1 hypothetical protein GXP67_15195 [Rhodocytophaga rosea]